MIVYVDTSAAMKLLVDEAESDALAEHLEKSRTRAGDTLVASLLLHTELHCASNRRPEVVHPDAVADVLSVLALVDVENGDLTTAPLLPGTLRYADAIHLATALRVDARELVAYDQELCSAATIAGIVVRSPR
ncbi:MAG: type II toxin-antitoxin system VapC family toxin [Actinomycetota bacterium]|jgi:predicted nucleic acid-binding protein|nr:type II toxin-antitoxin system VapC family toxin [Actinomycetota bacterium]MDA8342466.1 type II toxin-antitoxin system VapC family toxin [Actinomycetota bacterium]